MGDSIVPDGGRIKKFYRDDVMVEAVFRVTPRLLRVDETGIVPLAMLTVGEFFEFLVAGP